MSLQKIEHADLSSLADQMINEAAPLGEKPRRVVILVPHKSLGEWLSLRAARTNSIWMGVQVATLDEWMRVYPGEEKLSWMVFQEKQNLAWAQELASAFASYAIYRPEWLSGWLKNQPALPQSNQQLSSNWNANEELQRKLWQSLNLEKSGQKTKRQESFKKILVLEPPCLPPSYRTRLEELAESAEVKLYRHRAAPAPSLLSKTEFHIAHSPLRETEELRLVIQKFLEKHPEATLSDIAVYCPNLADYEPYIEQVFDARLRAQILPSHCATHPVLEFLRQMFRLAGSDYEAPDLLTAFEQLRMANHAELSGPERQLVKDWLLKTNVRRGLEGKESLRSGLTSLVRGLLMFDESDAFLTDSLEGSKLWAPVAFEHAPLLGSLAAFAASLRSLDALVHSEMPGGEWRKKLAQLLTPILGDKRAPGESETPQETAAGACDFLFGAADLKLSFATLRQAVSQKIEELQVSGQTLRGAVLFSDFGTLQGVPRKLVCCLGMSLGAFPRADRGKDLNLLSSDRLETDKDSARSDRDAWQATLAAAQEAFSLSWTNAALRQDTKLEELGASSEVEEWLRKAQPAQIHRHFLHSFSEAETCDPRWKPLQTEAKAPKTIWEMEPLKIEEGINQTNNQTNPVKNLHDLYSALTKAPKYFLRKCGVLLHEESDDLPAHEAFVVEGGLPKYAVQEGILRSLAGGGAEQKTEKDFLKKRLQGEFPQGKFWEKAKESSKRLIQELLAKQDLEGCPFQELPPLDDDEFGYEFNPALAKENGEIVFVLPSKNGGSKQLWHEIAHLALNLTQKTDTRLLLKDATVERKGMPPQEAKARLHQLWELKETLDQKMIPIFPDAAWEYARHKKAGDLKAAIESAWKKLNEYPDPYTQAMTGEAGSFEELGEGIAEKFAALSNELFPHGGENS